jgi:hypothetical protein
MKKISCVIILVLVAVFLTAGCHGHAGRTRWGTTRRTQIYNDGSVVTSDNQIFFISDYGMQSMNLDGSDRHVLNLTFIASFQIVDDLFVFSNRNYNGYIFSMQMDGTELQQLGDVSVRRIRVKDGWIFYNISRSRSNQFGEDGMGLYKMRMDGTEPIQITDDAVEDFYITEGEVYFSTRDGIFSIDFDGNNKRQLNDAFALSFRVAGEWIIFVNSTNEKIYRINIDGSDKRRLSDDITRSIYVVDDRIFFENEDDGEIYSIALDGSEMRRLLDDNSVNYVHLFTFVGVTLGGPNPGSRYQDFVFIYLATAQR